VTINIGGGAHGGVAQARGDGREVHSFANRRLAWPCRRTWREAPLGGPSFRQSLATVDETEFGINGEPSGLAKIKSRSLR
jgi:hypothetical protein